MPKSSLYRTLARATGEPVRRLQKIGFRIIIVRRPITIREKPRPKRPK